MHIENFASLIGEGCLRSSSWSCGLLTGHITSSVHPGVYEEGRKLVKGLRKMVEMIQERKHMESNKSEER